MKIWRIVGSTSASEPTEHLIIDRHVAPTEKRLPLLGDDFFQPPFAEAALRIVARQEHGARSIGPAVGQCKTDFGRLGFEELVRHLRENAAAVARQRIAPARAAMGQVDKNFQAAAQHVMAFLPLDMHDEADAARVVLVGGVVKTFVRRRRIASRLSGHGDSPIHLKPIRGLTG